MQIWDMRIQVDTQDTQRQTRKTHTERRGNGRHSTADTFRQNRDLCQCVGATDTAAAVARCLCADSSEWWERSVTDHGQDTNMTNDIYERLVARFCGPATSIEVPTVALVNRPEPQPPQQDLVLLWGPPGTGKTVVLTLKGMQWWQRAGLPEDCERCADNIVNLLVELRVGQSGHDLQYRDTVILCRVPRDNLPVVSRLRARGLPVQVVRSRDDEAAIRDVAVAMKDTIMVTDSDVEKGKHDVVDAPLMEI
nr:hypothetical protein BaRGS_003389 [Batillaria attramentaria]